VIKSQTRVAIGDQRVRTAERDASEQVGLFNGDHPMTKNNSHPEPDEAGKQIPALPRDAGSHANETVDGLDAASEALRHAAEDTPTGARPDDVETTPVFDRADRAPKI
jgi:hypothetical protein